MEVTCDVARADAMLAAAPGGISGSLVGNFRTLGQKFESLIKGTLLAGEVLDRRSGMGQRSIFYRIEDDQVGNTVTLVVGANLSIARYMRIHAYGGIIRTKNSKYLAIPLDAARTPSGVARFSARDVIANPTGHGYAATFFRDRMLFGVPLGTERRTRQGRPLVPLFTLKDHVQIPQNNYLAIARSRLDADVKEAFRGAVRSGVTANPGRLPDGSVRVR